MIPNEFFQRLVGREDELKAGAKVLSFGPGPFAFRVGMADVRAARLLIAIQDQYEDLTFGEMRDLLLAALWWMTFWAAQHSEKDTETASKAAPDHKQ